VLLGTPSGSKRKKSWMERRNLSGKKGRDASTLSKEKVGVSTQKRKGSFSKGKEKRN